MRISTVLWLSMAAAAPSLSQAGIFGSMWGSNDKEDASTVDNSSPKAGKRFIHDIIHDERRYLLFNSRQLSGDCISVCEPEEGRTDEPEPTRSPVSRTDDPTSSPTSSPTKSPTDDPTSSPTSSPTKSPTEDPTSSPTSSPTKSPTDDPTSSPTSSPTKSPTEDPTGTPTLGPTDLPTERPTDKPIKEEGNLDCEALVGLGYDFSKATGPNAYPSDKCYPHVRSAGFNENAGKDDSIAVFVGGSYTSKVAAEVEGRMVVMKDLTVESNGAGNFVSVGVGTHVLPNSDIDCIMVGGNIVAHRQIQVFNQRNWMGCGIVYKGSATNLYNWKNEQGTNRRDPNYDMSHYEAMKDVFYKKSQYWKTLPTTPDTRVFNQWGGTNFKCTGNDEIQVFNIQPKQRYLFTGDTWGYTFSNSCSGKTILINFQGTGDIKVNAVDLIWNDKRGYGSGGFPSCMTQSIMWNFPDASNVEIGNGSSSEFQGSVLITGNMKMTTTGHSGRTIVLGNLVHNKGGSEFHNYPYNPPIPLPEPDCETYLSDLELMGGGDGNGGGQQIEVESSKPTKNPTKNPTKKPTKKPTPPPTKKPTAPSGGGDVVWGGTCKENWANGCSNNNPCCDGLTCKKYNWGSQCQKDNNAQCLIKGDACHNSNKSCCSGLQCKGNKWWASCK